MVDDQEIFHILLMAIRSEEEAHRFYTDVAARVTDPSVQATFQELAREELGHKQFLESCQHDPLLLAKIPAAPDYRVAEATAEPALSIALKPAEALALAMKKEEQAARLYEGLAAQTTDPEYRRMFEGLARMELGHKHGLENLFVSIGFPEVF
ncbi:MAG: ferritin family protein [Myxococcota bacterium]|jgi:rubrerythrin|nr:ferritin family protein [Myxococcota bacterium]